MERAGGGLAGEQHRRCARATLMALALFGMLKNAGDCLGIGDFANHTKFPAAFRTHTQIDTEHPVEPGHPSHGRRGRNCRVASLLGADG